MILHLLITKMLPDFFNIRQWNITKQRFLFCSINTMISHFVAKYSSLFKAKINHSSSSFGHFLQFQNFFLPPFNMNRCRFFILNYIYWKFLSLSIQLLPLNMWMNRNGKRIGVNVSTWFVGKRAINKKQKLLSRGQFITNIDQWQTEIQKDWNSCKNHATSH